MLARARALQARALPHGPADVVRQVALFAAAYLAYRLVRGMVDSRASVAFENARNLIDAERALHIFVEPAVQGWTASSAVVTDVASWIYINAQTTVTISALVWLYLFRNESFYFVRNMMVVAMALALVGYVVFPAAPPRFFPEWGFFDAVSNFTGVTSDSVAVNALFNPYAAVPSMHVAFALMIGWTLARLVRSSVARVLWILYPFLMTFVIVVTANHFLVDAMLGALTAGASAYGATWLARARPSVWRFSDVAPGLTASG
jgi:PAP2 superfamily